MEESEIEKIKETVGEFLQKMTIEASAIEVKEILQQDVIASEAKQSRGLVEVNIVIEEPQVLIGQNGQTLFELNRLLRIMLNKKLQKDFYVDIDINDYKKKKIEYLKDLAVTLADQVVKNQEEKVLPPMPSYERRIIHAQLSVRQDVATESQGEGMNRCIVIKPK